MLPIEITQELKSIYRHWSKYTTLPTPQNDFSGIQINPDYEDLFWQFANERMSIWNRKVLENEPRPWTNDPLLQKFIFINVWRELDKQTLHFHKKYAHLRDDFDLWLLNMFAARIFRKIETVEMVGILTPENMEEKHAMCLKAQENGTVLWGSAYKLPSREFNKAFGSGAYDFIVFKAIPILISRISPVIKAYKNKGIQEATEELNKIAGGSFSFIWAELLMDIGYQYPELVDQRKNFYVGPGAAPSVKSLCKKEKNIHAIIDYLVSKQEQRFHNYLTFEGNRVYLTQADVEGLCCEVRKYYNLMTDPNGSRKRLFKG